MTPDLVAQLLVGKTVQTIGWSSHGWPMCVESITFTDGTVVDVSGNADHGIFEGITLSSGDYKQIYYDDNKV